MHSARAVAQPSAIWLLMAASAAWGQENAPPRTDAPALEMDKIILVGDSVMAPIDLTTAFRFGETPAPPPVLSKTGEMLRHLLENAAKLPPPPIPQAEQALPLQKKGMRKRVGSDQTR